MYRGDGGRRLRVSREFWWGRDPALQCCDLLCISCSARYSCTRQKIGMWGGCAQSQGWLSSESLQSIHSSAWPSPPCSPSSGREQLWGQSRRWHSRDPFLRTLTKVLCGSLELCQWDRACCTATNHGCNVQTRPYIMEFLHFIQLRNPDFRRSEYSVLCQICKEILFGFLWP